MNNRRKVIISIILVIGVILGLGLLGGAIAFQQSACRTRELHLDITREAEKNVEEELDKKQTNQEEIVDASDGENAFEEDKTAEKDELAQIFGQEVFEEKTYYVDDEDVARRIIKLQGQALRKTVSGNSEVREIEGKIEDNFEIEAVNLQDLDLEMAQYIEEACEYMYDRYPCLKGYITNILVQENISESSGVIALCDTNTFLSTPEEGELYPFSIRRRILLNAEDFYNPEKMKNLITRSVRGGHWRENTSVKSIFVHELTHCLVNYLISEENGLGKSVCITEEKGDAFAECCTQELAVNQTMEKDICNTAYKHYLAVQGVTCTYEEFCLEISGYAVGTQDDGGISYGETIAEAMTDVYINGENCNPASKAIIDEVEIRLKKLNLEVNT